VELNIVHEVAVLQRMTVDQLRQRFAELFGEATAASNRTRLIKRIAWRMQELAEGDVSERARRRAAELAGDADLRMNPPRSKSTTFPPEVADFHFIGKYFNQRLQTAFARVAPNPYTLRNTQGAPLFLLCFAAANPHAVAPAIKIAQDILKRDTAPSLFAMGDEPLGG
jgi:hypothetical protein